MNDFSTLFATCTSKEEVRKIFRQNAARYHPDTGGTKEQFQAFNEAYQRAMSRDFSFQFEQPGETPGYYTWTNMDGSTGRSQTQSSTTQRASSPGFGAQPTPPPPPPLCHWFKWEVWGIRNAHFDLQYMLFAMNNQELNLTLRIAIRQMRDVCKDASLGINSITQEICIKDGKFMAYKEILKEAGFKWNGKEWSYIYISDPFKRLPPTPEGFTRYDFDAWLNDDNMDEGSRLFMLLRNIVFGFRSAEDAITSQIVVEFNNQLLRVYLNLSALDIRVRQSLENADFVYEPSTHYWVLNYA